uniref:Pentraxin 3 n=1 Tax=Poecilia formosa TaxID=48698 RepID=A0A096M284_POEFO
MVWWRIPEAAFLLSVCACVTLAYEDDIEIQYSDYYNEISDGATPALGLFTVATPSSTPCNSPDLTKWDKIFSMMENSQMRENMLLQYVDDIVKVEMGTLRGDLQRFIAEYERSCGAAVETAGRRMVLQLESHLRETLELLKGLHLQEVTPEEVALDEVLAAMQEVKAELDEELKSRQRRLPAVHQIGFCSQSKNRQVNWSLIFQTTRTLFYVLPLGCEMALLFPMRSRRIYTAIIPDVPLALSAFTVCMWVKPTSVFNKTVLFSYGHRRNPSEIQLLLAQTSAVFTVGEEASQVEARSVVSPGQWIHLCGAWSSEQGLATLWVGGKKMASKPGMAKGHNLPEGGSLQLGQERNGCCPLSPTSGSGVAGFEGSFDPKLAFAGKMTGVNMWDTVLSEQEISQLAAQRGQGCQYRGSVVAWGVTEMVPHGGAQFIY